VPSIPTHTGGGVHSVADAAAQHPAPRVREAGLEFLRELAAEGDPFARDLLAGVT
jgi:hypothetical protein